jgi:hypothetical protein
MGEKEGMAAEMAASWRLNVSDFQMPERPKEPSFVTRVFSLTRERERERERERGETYRLASNYQTVYIAREVDKTLAYCMDVIS